MSFDTATLIKIKQLIAEISEQQKYYLPLSLRKNLDSQQDVTNDTIIKAIRQVLNAYSLRILNNFKQLDELLILTMGSDLNTAIAFIEQLFLAHSGSQAASLAGLMFIYTRLSCANSNNITDLGTAITIYLLGQKDLINSLEQLGTIPQKELQDLIVEWKEFLADTEALYALVALAEEPCTKNLNATTSHKYKQAMRTMLTYQLTNLNNAAPSRLQEINALLQKLVNAGQTNAYAQELFILAHAEIQKNYKAYPQVLKALDIKHRPANVEPLFHYTMQRPPALVTNFANETPIKLKLRSKP